MKVKQIVGEDAKITKSDTTGVEITADDGVKTTLPPEKAAALTPDPANPNEYDLNPTATSPTGDTPAGPKVGANVEIKTAEAVSDDLSTMPTTEFVKGIYAAAAENGMDAPEAEAVKKQMVLAPNGEVDIIATMQKALQAFQSPEFKQMLADLDALVKQAEAQQASNPELARIQELAGATEPAKQVGANIKKQGFPSLKPIRPPALPQQAASGERLEANPDGTTVYSGGFGTYVYDRAGKPIKYTSPNFSGITQTNDLTTGNITVRYVAGPLDVTANFDKTGKSLDSEKVQYDLGLGVMGHERNKGITATTWQDRGNNVIQSRDMVKDPAAYDRAMSQVKNSQVTNESKFKEELTAMLRIAKLK